RCLQQHLARSAFELSVHQNWNLYGIPIMRIVGRRLEPPNKFAVVGIERYDTARPRIVAGPRRCGQHWRGIACSHIEEIKLGVIRSRDPHVSASDPAAKAFGCFSLKRT